MQENAVPTVNRHRNLRRSVVRSVVIVAIVALLWRGYRHFSCSTFIVDDVTSACDVDIEASWQDLGISGLTVKVEGTIQGQAEIFLPGSRESVLVSGEFSVTWYTDTTRRAARFHYRPINVKNGYVKGCWRYQ